MTNVKLTVFAVE